MNGPSKRKCPVDSAGKKRFRSNLMALDEDEITLPVQTETEDKSSKLRQPTELLRSIVLGGVRAPRGIQTPACLLFRKRVFRPPRDDSSADLAATFQRLAQVQASQSPKITNSAVKDTAASDSAIESTDSSRSPDFE